MMKTTLIQDACIVNEGQMFQGSVLIEGERIVRIYKGDDTPSLSVMESLDNLVDARGKYLIPGLIDTHVHFRDPGLTHKADMTYMRRENDYITHFRDICAAICLTNFKSCSFIM